MSYFEQVVCIPKSLSNKNISLIGYRLIASLMMKSATAYNPFLYYFCNENFQAAVNKAFTCKPNQPQTINIKMGNIPQPKRVQAPHFGEVQLHPCGAFIPPHDPHKIGIYSEAEVTDVDQHEQPPPQQDAMTNIDKWENNQAGNEDFNQTGRWRGRGHGHGDSSSGGFCCERRGGYRGGDHQEVTKITVEIEVHNMAIEESIMEVTGPKEKVCNEELAPDGIEMDLNHPVSESTGEPHKAVWV